VGLTGRAWVAAGAILAGLAVAAGAFGAHALRGTLPAERLSVFETAARYQMYHAVGLVLVGLLASRLPGGALTAAGWLFTAGIALFSGSLYLVALAGARWAGAITPLGGICFLAGWVCLAAAGIRKGPS